MIKFKQGCITNPKTNVTKDILVRATAPNNLKEILIGGGIVMVGITYLTISAFKNGSKSLEEAEYRTLEDLGLV